MSHFVSAKDSNGYSFSHSFSDADWRKIAGLEGCRSGRVEFSEGVATIDDGTVFITLTKYGNRIYDLSASDVF